MNVLRAFRTVRHLSLSQLAYRPVCRGKFMLMEAFPKSAQAHFMRKATHIGSFNFANAQLAVAVAHVAKLQRAVHGDFLGGVAEGRFTLLNREIDFGGLDKIEWRRELGERNNRLWRMNLSYMGYLVPLVESYGRAALPLIESLLKSMTEQNSWSSRGVFRDVWHPYSVSHRIINLITCLSLLEQDGERVPAPTWAMIEAEIRLCASFLLGNLERDLQYNHLFKNFVCLAVVASALQDPANFARRQLAEVEDSIRQQFLADGGHAERAPMYHLLALIDLRILRDSDVLPVASALAVDRAVHGAERAANVVCHPDGDVGLFNDSWLGEAPAASALIDAVVERPREFYCDEFLDFGYARMAQDGDSVIFDYGACGPDANPGHAHADFLSLELSINGARAIVDPGVPTYSEGEQRDVSRSAVSHNGPCLVGAEPIEFWSSFRVGRRGYAYPMSLEKSLGPAIAGWQDGYGALGLSVARAIRLYPGSGLLVADLWQGKLDLPEQSGFLIAGRPCATKANTFNINTENGSRSLAITVLQGETFSVKPHRYCLKFGVPTVGSKVVFKPTADNGVNRCLGLWFSWGDERNAPMQDWEKLSKALISSLTLCAQ